MEEKEKNKLNMCEEDSLPNSIYEYEMEREYGNKRIENCIRNLIVTHIIK